MAWIIFPAGTCSSMAFRKRMNSRWLSRGVAILDESLEPATIGRRFVARAVGMGRRRQRQRGHITRQSWENGFIERFNARLRDELLDGEGFYSLKEARIVIESWRRHYNTERPQGSSGYKPPAPEAFVSGFAVRVPAPTPPAPPPALVSRPTMHYH
jgi:transposase InsO family protein